MKPTMFHAIMGLLLIISQALGISNYSTTIIGIILLQIRTDIVTQTHTVQRTNRGKNK